MPSSSTSPDPAVRERLAGVPDALRSQLWPLPVLAVVVAIALGILGPVLDAAVDDTLGQGLDGVLFGGDADAARTLLDAVSSSLITVTSLTFSLTVVTLQLASSQFSPRLLRTFTSDLFVQATLGLFLGTFTYSLIVLRSVRSSTSAHAEFVPRLSVTLSVVLGVASVVGLVIFLAHLAQQIRVETMLQEVHDDARTVLERHGPSEAPGPGRPWSIPSGEVPVAPTHAFRVLAPASGFLVRVDRAELARICTELDVVCVLDRPIGSSLVADTPIGWAWPSGAPTHTDLRERLSAGLRSCVRTGFERTSVQDVGYGLRQLTDVANKALSPGINDPTTAVHTLGHISALLCRLSHVDLDPLAVHDDTGQLRVVLRQPGFAELVETAIDQPRRYGASDPQVLGRLFQLLAELAWTAAPPHRALVRDQLARLRATVAAQDFDEAELASLADSARSVEGALEAERDVDVVGGTASG